MNRKDERRLIVGLLSCRGPARTREESLAWVVGAVRLEIRRRRLVRAVSRLCAVTVLGLLVLALNFRPFRSVSPDVPGADHAAESAASILRGSAVLAQASPLIGQDAMSETREGKIGGTGSDRGAADANSFAAASDMPIAIETINDQELLALLSGRTVALIGPPGHEQLLVLDGPGPIR